MKFFLLYNLRSLAILAGCLYLAACETDVPGPYGTDYPYSVFGILSPDADTQTVKVFPPQYLPQPYPAEPLDAVVTSTNLTTGEVRIWRDSIVANAQGQAEYAFWSTFRAEHGHTYRIDVVRSDGEMSSAETTVPPPVTIGLNESASPLVLIQIPGHDFRPLASTLEYHIAAAFYEAPLVRQGPGFISHEGEERKTADGWETPIRLDIDNRELESFFTPYEDCGRERCLILLELWLHLIVGDAAWDPPGGFLNPDALSHPGALANVQNGYGFVGSGYRIRERINLAPETIRDAGFMEIIP